MQDCRAPQLISSFLQSEVSWWADDLQWILLQFAKKEIFPFLFPERYLRGKDPCLYFKTHFSSRSLVSH